MTFHFEWHSMLSDIRFLLTFHVEWYSILSDIPFWVTFHLEWYSILSDIPFWVTFHFEWHSIWVTDWCLNLKDENWGGIRLSISNLRVSESVSEWVSIIRSRDASASKNPPTLGYKKGWGMTPLPPFSDYKIRGFPKNPHPEMMKRNIGVQQHPGIASYRESAYEWWVR